MPEIVKVCAIAVLGAVLAVGLKQIKAEYFTYMGIVLVMLFFGYGFRLMLSVMEKMDAMTGVLGDGAVYITALFKVVGITYLGECASSICKDCGLLALSMQIEILSKIMILISGMPILWSLIGQIKEFV